MTTPVVHRTMPAVKACRSCGLEQHHSWQQTGMARMFRAYDPANVIGDFGSGKPFYAEDLLTWSGAR